MTHKAYSDSKLTLKSMVYQLLSTPVLIAILILVTRDIKFSLIVGAIEFPVKLVIYFFFENFGDFMTYRIELWEKYSQ